MSKLVELINLNCSNGIEYKKLADVVSVERGRRVVRDQLPDNGTYLVYQNSLTPLGYYNDYNFKGYTTFVIGAGAAGEIGFSYDDFWAADDCYPLVCSDAIDDRYLYHYLLSQSAYIMSQVRRGSIPRLARLVIEKLVIPVPSIEIQREIVCILDNFTELTAELIAELTEELKARKQQYEYYRNIIFEFGECEYYSIAEIADTNIGLATSVTNHKRQSGVVLLHNSDIRPNKIVLKVREYISEEFALKNKGKILHKDDIITVHTGDVGTSAVIDDNYDGSIGFTTITTRIKDKLKVLPQYLCHYLNSNRCKQDIASMIISDRSNLNQRSFEKLMIPVPSLDEQNRIIKVLDHFESICSDITSGIPAEIAARQKQYEYYRDKLLSFPEYKGV